MADTSLPTREQELALHRRLVEDDPTATADLFLAYLDYLADYLARCPGTTEDQCRDAAEDALLALVRVPTSYHAEKATLAAYLQMSAKFDLKNLLQKERKKTRKHVSVNLVEDSLAERNYSQSDPSVIVALREEADHARTVLLPSVTRGLTDIELRVLELMFDGEKKTVAFAKVMAIEHLPKDEQEVRVLRLKNKLKKRLERRRPHDETP